MNRFFCLLLTPVLLCGCAAEELLSISVDGVAARVELALTPEQRMRGLMERERLDSDQGMLLVYPQPRIVQLWMLNTRIPLDVGFFDEHGVLVNRLSMQPDGGRKIYTSSAPAVYALEMNQGWFERHGVAAGARLALPDPPPLAR